MQRLELESLQHQPLEGSHVVAPNISLSQGVDEPNEYVKAYLAEQQAALQQQIEARQQMSEGDQDQQQPTDMTVQTNNTHSEPTKEAHVAASVNNDGDDVDKKVEPSPVEQTQPQNRRRTSSRNSESEDVTPSKRPTRSVSNTSRKSEIVDGQSTLKVEAPLEKIEQPTAEVTKKTTSKMETAQESVPVKKEEGPPKIEQKREPIINPEVPSQKKDGKCCDINEI